MQIPRFEYFTVNRMILFCYSVTVFQLLLQLQLLDIIQLLRLIFQLFHILVTVTINLNHTGVNNLLKVVTSLVPVGIEPTTY